MDDFSWSNPSVENIGTLISYLNNPNYVPSYENVMDSMEEYVYGKNPMEFSQSALGKKLEFMDSDVLNYYNTEMAAYRDMLKWQATNEWNLRQWNRENEYNSPSAEKQRYLEAGINPIWAMSKSNSGSASQVVTQQPHPSPSFTATMDAERLSQERSMFAQSNALQSTATMGELSLKERSLLNEISKTTSDIDKVKAETELLKSQLESNDWMNKINSVTFDVQVNLKVEELNRVRSEISHLRKLDALTEDQREYLSAQIEYEKTLTSYTEAMAKKVESETFDKLENLKMKWYELASQRIQANAAATSSSAALQQAQTSDASLNHLIEKDQAELKLKSNEQIIQLIDQQRGVIDRFIGTPSNVISGVLGNDDFEMVNRSFALISAGYKVICDRFYSNPTKVNADAIDKVQKQIDNFQKRKIDASQFLPFSSGTSVINPTNPSQGWNQ